MAQATEKQQMIAAELQMAPPQEARKGVIPDDRGMRPDVAAFPTSADNAALDSGNRNEPVVRQWQEQIGSAFDEDHEAKAKRDLRWCARHALPFFFLVSSTLWISIFVALRAIL